MTITSNSTDLTLNGPDISTKLSLSGGTMSGALTMGGQAINNAGAITGTSFIKSGGLTTQFLKANGDVDGSTYLTSANIANKLSIDGTKAMTGALNMGNQAINNSGIMKVVGFVKNG